MGMHAPVGIVVASRIGVHNKLDGTVKCAPQRPLQVDAVGDAADLR